MLDIAKIEQLKSSARLNGPLVCILIASQQFLVAVIFERYIAKILEHFWIEMILNFVCDFACGYFLINMLKSELDEIERMNAQTTR